MDDLIKALKITYEDLFVLHHNLIGANYYGDHEKLGEYYKLIQDIADTIIENAIALDYNEPTIADAVKTYKPVESIQRNSVESFTIVRDLFNGIIEIIENIKNDVPEYFKNLLEEKEEVLFLEANFKIKNLLK